jgi:hypothetical protein
MLTLKTPFHAVSSAQAAENILFELWHDDIVQRFTVQRDSRVRVTYLFSRGVI